MLTLTGFRGLAATLLYMQFPREHRTRIRSNNMLERILSEIAGGPVL